MQQCANSEALARYERDNDNYSNAQDTLDRNIDPLIEEIEEIAILADKATKAVRSEKVQEDILDSIMGEVVVIIKDIDRYVKNVYEYDFSEYAQERINEVKGILEI